MIVGVRLHAPTDAAAADVQAALPRASALRALLETRNATSQQALYLWSTYCCLLLSVCFLEALALMHLAHRLV